METPQTRVRSEAQRAEAASADKAGEYGRSAEFDCARAMAQAESVLREISLMRTCAHQSSREIQGPIREKVESVVPDFATVSETNPTRFPSRRSAVRSLRLTASQSHTRPLCLGLDFFVHDDGPIELTETRFRRIAQPHSAGLDVVIGVDRRDVFRFPGCLHDYSLPPGLDPKPLCAYVGRITRSLSRPPMQAGRPQGRDRPTSYTPRQFWEA
jgi:hypothetical protein